MMYKYNVYACKYPMFFQDCLQDNKDAYEKTLTPPFYIIQIIGKTYVANRYN
jgi:hypothetical protein